MSGTHLGDASAASSSDPVKVTSKCATKGAASGVLGPESRHQVTCDDTIDITDGNGAESMDGACSSLNRGVGPCFVDAPLRQLIEAKERELHDIHDFRIR